MIAGLRRVMQVPLILVFLLALSCLTAGESSTTSSSPVPATSPTETAPSAVQPPTDAEPRPLPKFYDPSQPRPAYDDTTAWQTISSFLYVGYRHIVPDGLDHILFVLGLFLLSPRLKPLLIQVTAFTIAHTLTIGLSMADVFSLPAWFVEPLIAASIAYVAVENIVAKEMKPWRWLVVFGFGLIHGLGFADSLKELGLPDGHFWIALVSFNVGVELGQLTVIAAAAALTWWCWNRPWYRTRVSIPASVIIGLIGAYWTVERIWSNLMA